MKKVLSIFALALALVACNDKPQWTPSAPSQPIVTSLTLETADEFDTNTLNRAEIHHIQGSVIKLSLIDETDYDVVDNTKAHNAQLAVRLTAAQKGEDDSDDGVLPCQILCVGPVNSINDIDLSLANTTNDDFVEPDQPATTEAGDAGDAGDTGELEPIQLQWDYEAVLPVLSTVAEEKALATDPNVYKASGKMGYIVRYSTEELDADLNPFVTHHIAYAVVIDSYSATEAVETIEVPLPNFGSSASMTVNEFSYSCVAGVQYKLVNIKEAKFAE